ncbi:MAG: ABC transporter permease [Acidimicrobiia bacterium]|jgi:ABC-type dipeptide/oligopeptide/nickel transport system permease subunit
MIALLAFVAVALFADLVAPFPAQEFVGPPSSKPSAEFWLGTDEVGRDVLSRVIFGTRTTLYVGIGATAVAAIVGIPMGLVSGFFGGRIDGVLMRITDALFAFPPIILAMSMVAALGPSLNNAVLAVGVVQVPRFARLIRGITLSVKEEEFVLAAESAGAGSIYMMRRAIFPNVSSVILVQLTLTFATAVLTEAALSFLGMGAQPPEPSWGLLLNAGKVLMSANPGMALGAGGAIFLTVLLFTVLGDALTDILDPRRGSAGKQLG